MTVAALFEHATRWRFNGIPRYSAPDVEGDTYVVGTIAEPLWNRDDLTPEQRERIGAEYFRLLDERDRRGRDLSDARIYGILLDEWGIACSHPPHFTRPIFDGKVPGYECEACLVWVCPPR